MEYNHNELRPGSLLHGALLTYRIIHKLGQGGFGITYLVEARVDVYGVPTNCRFALKEHFIGDLCQRDHDTQRVIYSQPVAGQVEASLSSFIKEARRLKDVGVDHPNIVKISEVFEANNTAYYVMEYLDGVTLQDFVRQQGPLTAAQASYYLRPIAEAVACLHGRHLTHYDIKPGNIILAGEPNGSRRPVLIDFGLSKHYDDAGHATSTLAMAGYSEGYSPVEQYAGIKTYTPQADVYALAATYWYCLTGAPPAAALTRPVDVIDEALAHLLPRHSLAAMCHAMAPFAADRTADAGAFVTEMWGSAPLFSESDSQLTDLNVPSQATRPLKTTSTPPANVIVRRQSRLLWIVAVAVLIVIVMIAWMLMRGSDDVKSDAVDSTHMVEEPLVATEDAIAEIVTDSILEEDPHIEPPRMLDPRPSRKHPKQNQEPKPSNEDPENTTDPHNSVIEASRPEPTTIDGPILIKKNRRNI